MSPRKLIFTNDLIYFQCRHSTWSEETNADQRPTVENWGIETLLTRALVPGTMWPHDSLCMLIQYFGAKELTHQEDALNAMAGITARFARQMKCRTLEGFPVAAFDYFLLFVSSDSSLSRREGFPSYSWAGWKGVCNWNSIGLLDETAVNDWLAGKTWIIWYKRSPSGTLNQVWDIEANEDFLRASTDDVGYRRRTSFPAKYGLGIRTTRTQPSHQLPVDLILLPYHSLQFWTMAIFCRIRYYQDTERSWFKNRFDILDIHGRFCGYLLMDGQAQALRNWSDRTLEFALLSLEGLSGRNSLLDLRSFENDSTQNTYSPDIAFWAMLIEWKNGIAERRGLGQIYQKALANSFAPGPVWKEILLG